MLAYVLKRYLRTPLPYIAVTLLMCTFSLVLTKVSFTINMYNIGLETIYNSMNINCVFSDPKGNVDGIHITNSLIDVCVSNNYELSQYISAPLFKRSLQYRTDTGEALLIGVNSSRLDERLNDLSDSVFSGSDKVIFVSEDSKYKIGDIVILIVRLDKAYEEVEFNVGGVYSGEDDTIYCPWNVICRLAESLGGNISAESGSFTLADNYKLTEFKAVASEYFAKVDISGNNISNIKSGIALIIQDNEFQIATTATNQIINMLNVLTPALYMLSIGVGFLVSFLLIRNRYAELKLLRTLGIKPQKIILLVLFEYALPALIGIGFSMIIVRKIIGAELLLFYIIGAFISLQLLFHKSIMRTRSD